MTTFPKNSISFIRLPEAKKRTGLTRSSIYLKIQRGEFPAPVSLGARAVGWIEGEVDKWVAARISASRGGAQ